MHHFTPSLHSLPGKWIAFEPLSILIKLPLLWGVSAVKHLMRPVNYNTAPCFTLFNYHFHWLEQPSSHFGLPRPKLTWETRGQPVARGKHAHARPGRKWGKFPPAGHGISWNVEGGVLHRQGWKMEVPPHFQPPLLMLVTARQTLQTWLKKPSSELLRVVAVLSRTSTGRN